MYHIGIDSQRRAFRIHAIVFFVVLLSELIVNALLGPPYWVIWVAAGWSVGLACHWYFGVVRPTRTP